MRNKIGHGDFIELNKIHEVYAQEFMEGYFDYDYSEYSSQNWILLHICCKLDEVLAQNIFMMLTDKPELEEIKRIC